MQFEEFDKKVKEAAENHHPAYDEQAWAKMNNLLDKHLPEKDERRRRFAWLFFLLFLLGGAGIFYGVQSLISSRPEAMAASKKGSATNMPEATDQALTTAQDPEATKGSSGKTVSSAAGSTDLGADGQTGEPQTTIKIPVAGEVKPLTASGRNQVAGTRQLSIPESRTGVTKVRPASNDPEITPVFQSGNAKKKKKQNSPAAALRSTGRLDISDPVGTEIADAKQEVLANTPEPGNKTTENEKLAESAVIQVPVTVATASKKDTVALDASPATAAQATKSKKPKKQSHLFLTLSAGPDASFAGSGKPGRIIAVTGAGIGYSYRDRFSIRAGFYNAAKSYTASPEAYNAPPNFYNYYPYLVKVDANCRVYEIPVSLGYHFAARKNHSWFAAATVSSYLMKRETYNYSYKTSAWGTVQQREWNLYNRNKHLFSVLGISGGYQRKITERISFVAEPYLRLPLQGVGYGKVKLNSAGVLFSLAVQPAALVPRKQKK